MNRSPRGRQLMRKNFSKPQLLIFICVFALLGLIILIKSFAAPNPNLLGDLNNDNVVDISDLSTMLSDFGSTDPTKIAQADIIKNNSVDIFDLSALLSNFGKSGGSTTGGGKLYYHWDFSADPATV